MRRTVLFGIWWVAAASACTPLGLWVYEDPGFEVSRVRIQAAQIPDSTVMVALALWNPNDYDISTERLELDLRLDDQKIGRFERDSVVSMAKIGTTTLALAFTPTSAATPGRLAAFRSGTTHRFLVEGRAVFKTPFGERKVRVAHAGAMAFGGVVEPAERRPALPLSTWSPSLWPRVQPNPQRQQ